MILTDFARALGQLGDPRFLRVVILGIVLTLALLVGAGAGLVWLAGAVVPETVTLPWIGEVTWPNALAAWGTGLAAVLLSVVLMVPVAAAVSGLFLDRVADAVEMRHYPHLGPAPGAGLLGSLADSLGFLVLVLVLNALALLVYLLLPVTIPFLFVLLNGWLLGREYFQMVALRRLSRAEARALRRRSSGQIWLAGILMTLPLSVPLVNLIVPVLGAATFTHLFHRLNGYPGGGPMR